MKKLLLTSLIALLVTAGTALKAQNRADDYLGLPGDNLNLYAVMNLFQESQTLEEFERKLNDENSRINNLDLNRDNYVDYISVTDYPDGNVHTIVMQVPLGPNEKQDVGVFTVERFRDGSVQIQLIGDEALYGRNYIIEPIYAETPNPGYTGSNNSTVVRTTYVEVATWPVIRFIYDPGYVIWRSSWYWGYYPVYWNPWRPFYYHHYYGYHYHLYDHYHTYYRHWDRPRYVHYHDYYYNRLRSHSPAVVININKGYYKTTYSKPQSRRDGEAMYARERAKSAAMTSTRRSSGETSNGRAASVSQRSANRSSEATRQSNRTSTTVRQSGTGSREAVNTRSTNARPSSSSQTRSTAASPSSSSQTRSTAARPSSSPQTRSSAARPSSSSQTRSTAARSSSSPQTRSSAARPSSSSQTRSAAARPSSSSQTRSTAARSSSSGNRQSAVSQRSASKPSSAARSKSSERSVQATKSSSGERKSEENRSRR